METKVESTQEFSCNTLAPLSFAHPSEKDFSDLLSFYRIQWLYEAVCFPLARDPEGKVTESFTPDFYLPEYNVFIEVTTLRQKHVTKKNRKIRLFRQLYPEVSLVIIYRRSFESLLLKLGIE
ncbi:MAG: hypothetical protein HY644_07635 [Acidobacteria bacterium]|nr:hypothetical protein [Acidobacteriota bacterium]